MVWWALERVNIVTKKLRNYLTVPSIKKDDVSDIKREIAAIIREYIGASTDVRLNPNYFLFLSILIFVYSLAISFPDEGNLRSSFRALVETLIKELDENKRSDLNDELLLINSIIDEIIDPSDIDKEKLNLLFRDLSYICYGNKLIELIKLALVIFLIKPKVSINVLQKENDVVVSISNESTFRLELQLIIDDFSKDSELFPQTSENIPIPIRDQWLSRRISLKAYIRPYNLIEFPIQIQLRLRSKRTPPYGILMAIFGKRKGGGNIRYRFLLFGESVSGLSQLGINKIVDMGAISDLTRKMLRKMKNDEDVSYEGVALTNQLIPEKLAKLLLRLELSYITLITNIHWIPWEALRIGDEYLAMRAGLIRQFITNEVIVDTMNTPKGIIMIGNMDGNLPNAEKEVGFIYKFLCESGFDSKLIIPYKDLNDPSELHNIVSSNSPMIYHIASHLTQRDKELLFPLRTRSITSNLSLRSLVSAVRSGSALILNSCRSLSRETFNLIGNILREGKNISVFIGTRTEIKDSVAISFAKGLYRNMIRGKSLVESVHKARLEASKNSKSMWLSFVAFGNPLWKII